MNLRQYVEAGSDRLVELEKELNKVRMQVNPPDQQGVIPAYRNLQQALKSWVKKKLH